jgi:predicted nucleic acid-binding protein
MANEPFFLDTSGWIALLNASDSLHSLAKELWDDLVRNHRTVVLTDWVIAETGNGLARTAVRGRFAEAVALVQTSPIADVVSVSYSSFDKALELYASRTDKTWGLVDCASFVVMDDLGISEVLTNDHHFEQAGFRCLLKQA